ncbi:MAG TPA: RHS repeat-associated core domain-containing protein, partial [Pyrinomonadaceae bacterium]|nr:RHS repeat-associated core domain-containing protein [Pyrinomonadaceae bacterium]
DGVRQHFTQKERDNETGLDYFGARYHSNTQGRFTSPDPLVSSGRVESSQSWNRFSYVLNNPLAFTDPFGLYEARGMTKEQIATVTLTGRAIPQIGSTRSQGVVAEIPKTSFLPPIHPH